MCVGALPGRFAMRPERSILRTRSGGMGDTGQTREPVRGLTFDDVWALFQETDRKMQETGRQIKELSKNIGGLNNAFGKWAEEMVSAKLWEKFRAIGYAFTHGGPHEFWEGGRVAAQVDVLLENGEYAMAVEVKSELTAEDVDDHIRRIGKVREQLDKRGEARKLAGAVAAMVAPKEGRKYALKKGLYVLVQSGDTVVLAEPPEGFAVREWHRGPSVKGQSAGAGGCP